MTKYQVTGMSCAACVSHVEKAVQGVDGVTFVAVNLLTNSMNVEGTAAPTDIENAVKAAGYGASLLNESPAHSESKGLDRNSFEDTETPKLLKRLIVSVILLLPLMYVSMGHMMWNWPLPKVMESNHIAMGLYQMLFAIMIMVVNQKFFISGFRALFRRTPNMDTLVAIGSAASFAYSTYALFAMTGAQLHGDETLLMELMHEFYFESAAMILALITVGKTLESYSKGKTTNALKSLMELAPQQAVLLINGEEKTVSVDQVKPGDLFVVRPGERIPVDGEVVGGIGAVDESALTGESIPVDKEPGAKVSAATLNQSGFLTCKATRVGQDTTLSQIIQMVSDASATKAPIAKIADKVSGVFVPCVLLIALITFVIWMLVGQTFGFSLSRAVSVLVISCPCALGLATPVAIMVGNGVGAKNGILYKTAVSLEMAGKVQVVALDKTGTITNGHPKVTDIIPDANIDQNKLLSIAYSLESKSEHPLARAICDYGSELGLHAQEVDGFKATIGNGLSGVIDGYQAIGGNARYLSQMVHVPKAMIDQAAQLGLEGKTPLYFACNDTFLGMIAVADTIKEESPEAIRQLHEMGIKVVMLTGDNRQTAEAIGKKAGVDHVIAGVLPDGKESVIRKLSELGSVAMVGDGINDAPALTTADLGIAIGAGSDIAIDAADVVLVNSKLTDVPAAIRLSRRVIRNIHENLFWAFFYNVIGIPLAAGAWYYLFGLKLNPMFGAAAMSLSSFCVVMNALRLNLVKVQDTKRDKEGKSFVTLDMLQDLFHTEKNIEEDSKEMVKTIEIKGMMCPHCEKHMKDALEALEAVDSAVTSHTEGTAVVTLSADVSDDVFKQTVTDAGYEFIKVR